MKVVVAVGRIDGLSSADAASALARAWAARGAQVAVVPMGAAGPDFAAASADTADPPHLLSWPGVAEAPTWHVAASSAQLGERVLTAVDTTPAATDVVLNVCDAPWHDGGAGLLGVLGATADRPLMEGVAGLRGITRIDLTAVQQRIAGRRLHLVVPAAEVDVALCGLHGITPRRMPIEVGRGDAATMLAIDQALLDLATAAGVRQDATRAPSGAAGGLGLAVSLLGGSVLSGPASIAARLDVPATIARSDLVVTGASRLDFGTMGGDVVTELTSLARDRLVPVIAVAHTNHISPRELRQIGLEAAYSLASSPDQRLDAVMVTRAAAAIAGTWCW